MRSKRASAAVAVIVLLVAAGAGVLVYANEQERAKQKAIELTGGSPAPGRALIREFGCGGCHTVAGVPGAVGLVGPPLDRLSRRVYIAGVLVNNPDNLVGFIVDPKAHSPRTAMPRTGISAEQARQVAAYLYTLN